MGSDESLPLLTVPLGISMNMPGGGTATAFHCNAYQVVTRPLALCTPCRELAGPGALLGYFQRLKFAACVSSLGLHPGACVRAPGYVEEVKPCFHYSIHQ